MKGRRGPFVPLGSLVGEARFALEHGDRTTALLRLDEYERRRRNGEKEPRRCDDSAQRLRRRANGDVAGVGVGASGSALGAPSPHGTVSAPVVDIAS